MYGNYCGPYWSAGKFQTSVVSDVEPTDRLDSICKEHDEAYALGLDLEDADLLFAYKAYQENALGKLFSFPVYLQYLFRKMTKNKNNPSLRGAKGSSRKPGLRGSMAAQLERALVQSLKNNPRLESRKSNMAATLAPVNVSRKLTMTKPKISATNGHVRIKHREYMTTAASATSFSVARYSINPGLPYIFPWLASVAGSYTRYRFRTIRFTYVPACSTSTAGRICLAFNENSIVPTPATKSVLFSYVPNDEQAMWTDASIVYHERSTDWRYVRQYNTTDTLYNTFSDPRITDAGVLFVASDMGSASTLTGEIYVEYDIELSEPAATLPLVGQLYSTSSSSSDLWPNGSTSSVGAKIIVDDSVANTASIGLSGYYLFTVYAEGTTISNLSFAASAGSMTLLNTANKVITGAQDRIFFSAEYGVVVDGISQVCKIVPTITCATCTKFYLTISLVPTGSVLAP